MSIGDSLYYIGISPMLRRVALMSDPILTGAIIKGGLVPVATSTGAASAMAAAATGAAVALAPLLPFALIAAGIAAAVSASNESKAK
jgi:hypothetical protein